MSTGSANAHEHILYHTLTREHSIMTALADDGVIAALEIREASGPGEQGVSIDLPVEFDFIRIKLDDGRIVRP